MNRLGRLNVDEFLQVKDVPDVYAIGDCNDVPEIKLAHGAQTQGNYVADNLKLKHEGKDMKPYNVNSTFTVVLFVCLFSLVFDCPCGGSSTCAAFIVKYI